MEQLSILEGLLFIVGDEGLTLEQTSEVLEITTEEAEKLFKLLQDKYESDEYGIEVARFGDYYKFLSKAAIHPYAKKLFASEKKQGLSPAALETLAIIAYKQPITRIEIEELRGVGADMMIRKLLARNLIKEVGRSEAPGRPILYEVTNEFLDSFKLLSLDELPDLPDYEAEDEDNNLFN